MANKPSKIQQRLAGLAGHGPYARHGSHAIVTRISAKEQKQKKDAVEAALANPKRVIFMSRDDASCYRFNADEDVLISISDTGVSAPAISHVPKDMLAIDFHDHVYSNSPEEHRWYMRDQAKQVAQFVIKHTDIRNIVIHCNYGEQRSKAMALAIKHDTKRSVFKCTGGIVKPYLESGNKGNERVYDLTAHMLLACSENVED